MWPDALMGILGTCETWNNTLTLEVLFGEVLECICTVFCPVSKKYKQTINLQLAYLN